MAATELQTLRDTLRTGTARWDAGDNSISGLARPDIQLRLGADPPTGSAPLAEREKRAAVAARTAMREISATLPAAVDWHAVGADNYLGAVRDQAQCGSCVAFGTIAAIEGSTRVLAKKASLACDLSEAHLFYCHGAADGRSCNTGWWPSKALDAAKTKGIVDEACFPYTAGDQACRPCADAASRTTKIKSWTSLTTTADMKQWLADKGPLIGCFTVYEDFRFYKSGVYHHVSGAQLGGHCICIVGYSNADNAWIARNSWGPDWGEGGYFRIGFGECGIDFEMWGVEPVAKAVVDAVVKVEKVLITGLWANSDAVNAQCFVDTVGWRKLPKPEILTAAAAAKVSKSLCTLTMKGDTITEIYVF